MSKHDAFICVGFDPSTVTGVAAIEADYTGYLPLVNREIRVKDPKIKGIERVAYIRDRAKRIIDDLEEVHLIVFEGYAYRNRNTLSLLTEIGTGLRLMAHDAGIPQIDISPKELKQYITGSGNASKAQVMRAIKARGMLVLTDNMADAAALAFYGLWSVGRNVVNCTETRRKYRKNDLTT